jgi:hypothetical protein
MIEDDYNEWAAEIDAAEENGDRTRLAVLQCRLLLMVLVRLDRAARPQMILGTEDRLP